MSWLGRLEIRLDDVSSGPRVAAGVPNVVDSASSSSIEAGSYFFSVKPSPSASAFTSYALMRSTSRSKCSRIRGSVRPPYGDSSSTSTARSNSCFAASKWPCSSSLWPALKWRSELGDERQNRVFGGDREGLDRPGFRDRRDHLGRRGGRHVRAPWTSAPGRRPSRREAARRQSDAASDIQAFGRSATTVKPPRSALS